MDKEDFWIIIACISPIIIGVVLGVLLGIYNCQWGHPATGFFSKPPAYCTECGYSFYDFCPECGHEYTSLPHFCKECGYEFDNN